MKTFRIALIGFGNVGRAFARMLARKREYIEETFGVSPQITSVATRRWGGLVCPEGIGEDLIGTQDPQSGWEDRLQRLFDPGLDAMDVIKAGEYDVMIELTPINIMTGQPATDHVRTALEMGKHAITANKGPIAWAYWPLRDLARKQGVCFLYEATVMDGTPVYNLSRENLMGCRITEVSGIFNATTNFILTQMEKGVTFEDAVEEGRRQGFVEADPSMDIDGWDAAAKLTALMNVLMDAEIRPDQIQRTGIGHITIGDIEEAAAQGKRIKLLCRGRLVDGKPVGTVEPVPVDRDSLPAIMDATSSYVTIDTDLMGATTVIEEPFEPEIDHTAYGVLSDVLRILKEEKN